MIEVSSHTLRTNLIERVLNNTLHELLPKKFSLTSVIFPPSIDQRKMLPNNAYTLGNYYYLLRLAEVVACLKYEEARHNTMASAHLGKPIKEYSTRGSSVIPVLPLVATVMYADLGQVNAFVAAAAWLTTDDFRWHNQDKQLKVPETLSYGLVLQYPDFILPYCSVIADYGRAGLEKDVADYIKEKIKISAVEQIRDTASGSEKIKDFLNQHK